jgi:hypothetical protein
MIHRETLTSTALSSVTYDDETEELSVTFASGGTYTHEGVPFEVYRGLTSASSPGRFYHANIKGQY